LLDALFVRWRHVNTPSRTNCKQGDIVLVAFPFTDLSSARLRPALMVSANAFNSVRDDVLVVAIASQVPATLAVDEFLIPAKDLALCGLPTPSIAHVAVEVIVSRWN
jgi:mRNA interferase MazF